MKDPIFVLFTATKVGVEGADGVSSQGDRWCPDCVEAHEVLDEVFEKAPASVYIIEIELNRTEWKEDPGDDHWLRKGPYNVSSIPTFAEWNIEENKPTRTVLRDADCSQMERISCLINDSIQ